MIRLAVIGLGKMGLSHYSMINAHPGVKVEAICDANSYILDVLSKYTGIKVFTSAEEMFRSVALDAIIVATPSSMHGRMVKDALNRGLHVFCEKPFCLNSTEGVELAELAEEKGLVGQVGYHCRFVGAFQEVKRLLNAGSIGRITHVLAEAYGPVVLRHKGSTWRTKRTEGGGCLFDYAAHPIDLVNWYFGMPVAAGGTVLNSVFSEDTEDEVFGTLHYADGKAAQLSVSWSDESYRKMSTKISIWGTHGRIYADRQECQAYLRDDAVLLPGYGTGWNVRYTTDLTKPVWFYLRGEEYSAQLDYFVKCVAEKKRPEINSFRDGAVTDQIIGMMVADSARGPLLQQEAGPTVAQSKRKGFFSFR